MKKNRTSDVVYNYTKHHGTREQIITALRSCANPVRGCKDCIYKELHTSACIMHLMEDAAHELEAGYDS